MENFSFQNANLGLSGSSCALRAHIEPLSAAYRTAKAYAERYIEHGRARPLVHIDKKTVDIRLAAFDMCFASLRTRYSDSVLPESDRYAPLWGA